MPSTGNRSRLKRFGLAGRWRPFAEARAYARKLGLASRDQWRAFAMGRLMGAGPRPPDIPAVPGQIYRYHGWAGYDDWLGRPSQMRFRAFAWARRFVRSLELETVAAWRQYAAGRMLDRGVRPKDIPASPERIYRSRGWVSWVDWLGTATVTKGGRVYAPFAQARDFARALRLRTAAEWDDYARGRPPADMGVEPLPEDIPAFPHVVYAEAGWASWRDWLGLPMRLCPRSHRRDYEDARRFVQRLGLRSQLEWRRYVKGRIPWRQPKPPDIPASPHIAYRSSGWRSWGEWLGTGRVANGRQVCRSFEEARRFARSLGLRSGREWQAFCRGEIPARGALPEDIPRRPARRYRASWEGMGDWLGNGSGQPRPSLLRPFPAAREFARGLGLRSACEWRSFCAGDMREQVGARPPDIPTNPNASYRGRGWISWGDWLGTGTVVARAREYRPFAAARRYVRGLKLASSMAWRELCARNALPSDIPRSPSVVYRGNGWRNWGDWLGTGRVASDQLRFRPYAAAREFARGLGLRSRIEWRRYRRGDFPARPPCPDDIPSVPGNSYGSEWTGWSDFLGSDACTARHP